MQRKPRKQPSSYRERTEREQPALPRRSFPAIKPYVVQWGQRGSQVEFFSDPAKVNERLNELWDNYHSEAQARLTTWIDVVLHQQAGL